MRNLPLALETAVSDLTNAQAANTSEEREKHIFHFGGGFLAQYSDACGPPFACSGNFDPNAVDYVLQNSLVEVIDNDIPIHTWEAHDHFNNWPYNGDPNHHLLVSMSDATGGIYGEGNSNEEFIEFLKQLAPRYEMIYDRPHIDPGVLEDPRVICRSGERLVDGECHDIQYDFGDAPDGLPTGYNSENNDPSFPTIASIGNFPTLLENDGARALNVNEVVLGTSASLESDANDPLDIDGIPNLDFVNEQSNWDSDDGVVQTGLGLNPKQWYAEIYSPIGGTFYLNALLDKNFDGTWIQLDSEPTEWIQNNEVIILEPNESVRVELDTKNVEYIEYGMWMRVMITYNPVETNWGGTGVFNVGEIEDVFAHSDFKIPGDPGDDGRCPPNNPMC